MSVAAIEPSADIGADPRIEVDITDRRVTALLSGCWTAKRARTMEERVRQLRAEPEHSSELVLDMAGVEGLDSVGAWILDRTRGELAAKRRVAFTRLSAEQSTLLKMVAAHGLHPVPRRDGDPLEWLVALGKAVADAGGYGARALSFIGQVVITALRVERWRRHFRLAAFVHQMELICLRAVPIVALISFLVGAIVSQQGIFQLQRFGGAQFVVELVGFLQLRELGVLLTAIMVAGRSGSSFTAELGAMKMREEIDALRVMGLDPIEVLIIPRLAALIAALPLLTFIADMSGLLGGGLVAWLYGDISPVAFLERLKAGVGIETFLVGLIKAPFMAAGIAVIASIEGLNVAGSAESLGQHVTSSVVKAIFSVIVLDSLFALFFAAIRY